MNKIDAKHVNFFYGDFQALKDISMTIEEKSVVAFIGPSGCGKSTFLRLFNRMNDLIPGSRLEGEILIDGRNIYDKSVQVDELRKSVGMVFQRPNPFPKSIFENVAYGLRVNGVKDNEFIRHRVEETLKGAALWDEVKNKLKESAFPLSGGQQQRVALARAIVLEPKILCLDEPLSNLDAKLRIDMRMELKRLQKELGITTLYVTHDQEEALTLSDRIAVFNNGYVEQVGTPYEIYNESKSEFVCDFIGDINRLKGELLSEVNTQSGANLDTNKTGFVRIERCISEEKAGYVKLTGKVEEAEFSGVLTKYVLECHGQELKYLEKNDGRRLYQENEQIDLYINPQDIMQF